MNRYFHIKIFVIFSALFAFLFLDTPNTSFQLQSAEAGTAKYPPISYNKVQKPNVSKGNTKKTTKLKNSLKNSIKSKSSLKKPSKKNRKVTNKKESFQKKPSKKSKEIIKKNNKAIQSSKKIAKGKLSFQKKPQKKIKNVSFNSGVKGQKNLSGPILPKKGIGETFAKGKYVNRKLQINETFYRYHGVDNRTGKKYSWYTNKLFKSEAELREQLAIRKEWGVITFVSKINVPKGTWVSEGIAAAQGAAYPGGGYQAVIKFVPKTWIQNTTKAFK